MLPKVNRRPSAVPPGMTWTPVSRSDGRIPAGGIAQASAEAAGAEAATLGAALADAAADPLGAALADGVAMGAVVAAAVLGEALELEPPQAASPTTAPIARARMTVGRGRRVA